MTGQICIEKMPPLITVETASGSITATKAKEGVWYYNNAQWGIYAVKLCMGCTGFIRLTDAIDELLERDLLAFWENRIALQKFTVKPLAFLDQMSIWTNWGGGWQWEERKHPKQPYPYLGQATVYRHGQAYFHLQRGYSNSMPDSIGYFATQADYLPYSK